MVRKWQRNKNKLKKDVTDDIAFIKTLLSDLDTIACYDSSRVHAAGLGTGGGMVHLIACDPELSTKFASYAIVAGGFGTKTVSPQWGKCDPGRLPIPLLEIHGEDDSILPYLLNDWEPARSRMAVPLWLEEWSERNMCGGTIGEPREAVDGTDTVVKLTMLEHGGWMSEAEAYDGAAYRVAKSCPAAMDKHNSTTAQAPPLVIKSNNTEESQNHQNVTTEEKEEEPKSEDEKVESVPISEDIKAAEVTEEKTEEKSEGKTEKTEKTEKSSLEEEEDDAEDEHDEL